MAADLRWLRGKIEENPLTAEMDLDRLLVGLLHSLVEEQKVAQMTGEPGKVCMSSLEGESR